MSHPDTFRSYQTLEVSGRAYRYFSLKAAAANGLGGDIARLPYSLKILLENLLRFEDGRSVKADDIRALGQWVQARKSEREIAYRPSRVLMQDFTGVPAVVDLAAMRDAMIALKGKAGKINPLSPVDLVIDHSVMVDHAGQADSLSRNAALEFSRNKERYAFLRWGQKAFDNFRVVPPGAGICHQVNLEYLARVVWTAESKDGALAYPDTCVGTDSHTTMINGLGVLGWGVGGIEAEAAMLGQPVSMLIPEVVGMKLTGTLKEGVTATDLVLTVTQMLRKHGVVGKFVEFFGGGLDHLPLPDRATLANMAPEYGATCGFFPVDGETMAYLKLSGRPEETIALVESYAKAQGLWRNKGDADPVFTQTLSLDLSAVEPSLAGPKRPQDRVPLSKARDSFLGALPGFAGDEKKPAAPRRASVAGADHELRDGDVVIAAITSCTNTSNPGLMIAAGLLARNAVARGLRAKPWVKTSLAPGSQVVADYLARAALQAPLDALGFNLVGFGCTTCIGNSGPLSAPLTKAIEENDLAVSAVLSGNRNFEGRISPHVKANYLASPPLVVAYALAGSILRDITTEPLGKDSQGNPVTLKDIWPPAREVAETLSRALQRDTFVQRYKDVFTGGPEWQAIATSSGETFGWESESTYVRHPPYFESMAAKPAPVRDIKNARILALMGDSVTTDHISPAGNIAASSPAARYLESHGVARADFNSYGARRGNHEVMMRGTFANTRLRNEMTPDAKGGMTRHIPSNEVMSIYDAAMRYRDEGVPLVVVAGKEYGTGSSRDWAAKGPKLLGIAAALAESFERIHRSNLIGMGILPLEFLPGETRQSLGLTGEETVSITGLEKGITPGMDVPVSLCAKDGKTRNLTLRCRIDTEDEAEYYRHGGILSYVLRNLSR